MPLLAIAHFWAGKGPAHQQLEIRWGKVEGWGAPGLRATKKSPRGDSHLRMMHRRMDPRPTTGLLLPAAFLPFVLKIRHEAALLLLLVAGPGGFT